MENKKIIDTLEFRSEDVQEILSKPPSRIAWFSYVTFIITIMLIIYSLQNFKYNNYSSEISLQLIHPPQKIVSPVSGLIKGIYVNNKQVIKKGQKILLIDTTLIKSSIQGIVNYQNFITEEQRVNKHDELLTILPSKTFVRRGVLSVDYKYRSILNTYDVIYLNINDYKSKPIRATILSISNMPDKNGNFFVCVIFDSFAIDANLISNSRDLKLKVNLSKSPQ